MGKLSGSSSHIDQRGLNAPAWLVARPIAHRGLHDRARGIMENSPGAADAAIAHSFAIECDVQITRDGEAMVFHDFALARLTGQDGLIRDITASQASQLTLSGSTDHVPTLSAFLTRIAGRTPLIIEIKSSFDGNMALIDRVASVIANYRGPVAIKSFDPDIVEAAAKLCPDTPRGIVAQAVYDDDEWSELPLERAHGLANLLHMPQSKPDFISWRVGDLPCAAPFLCRHLGQLPLMTWTVRTAEQRTIAAQYADQMVFEGFMP
jgi:glycerophosphoryl diester phosphodiesterase